MRDTAARRTAERHTGLPDLPLDVLGRAAHVLRLLVELNRQIRAFQERQAAVQEQRDIGRVLRADRALQVQLLADREHREKRCGKSDDRDQNGDRREVHTLLAPRIPRQRGKGLGERLLRAVEDVLHRVA